MSNPIEEFMALTLPIEYGNKKITTIETDSDNKLIITCNNKKYIFTNVSTMVPDGTTHEEIIDGEVIEVKNLVLDVLKSIKLML